MHAELGCFLANGGQRDPKPDAEFQFRSLVYRNLASVCGLPGFWIELANLGPGG